MAKIKGLGESAKKVFPDKFEMLEKAMEITNGKCDNDIARQLLFADDVTTEDFVRLAGKCNTKDKEIRDGRHWCGTRKPEEHVLWQAPERYGNIIEKHQRRMKIRKDRNDDATKYMFRDTFLYRIVKESGFPFNKIKDSEDLLKKEFRVSESPRAGTYTYKNTITDALHGHSYGQELLSGVYLFMKLNKNLRDEVANDPSLCDMWIRYANADKYIHHPWSDSTKEKHPITCTEEEFVKFQTQAIVNEFDWLSKMPKNLKEQLKEYIEKHKSNSYHQGYNECPPPFYTCVKQGVNYPAEDKVRELVEEAFGVMNYIGLGICFRYKKGTELNFAYSDDVSSKMQPILKKIAGTMRVFVSQVRKGYNPEDVREMIVEDVNNWIITKVGYTWQLYVRTDAPKAFPDIEPKKKKSTKKVGLNSLEADPNNEVDAKMIALIKSSENN